VTAAVEATAR